ncbi:MAG: hypothetical protein LBF63_05545 [Treponema sp.]|jgi:hypothetical protein|nr:hypothetical protein [Treponema sp.]
MKWFLPAFLLSILIFPNAFGQERKHTLVIDLFPMINGIFSGGIGLGIGYEYDINNYFAIGADIKFYTDFNESLTYNMIIRGKYYPLETKTGSPFIDAGLGYRRRQAEEDNIHCLVGMVCSGWKFTFKNNLVLEPGVGFRYDIVTFSGNENYKFGFVIRSAIGFTF